MGKKIKPNKLAPRWILCTRWEAKDEKGKLVEKVYTPIGTNGGIPFSYASYKEAERAMYDMMDFTPEVIRLQASALKVKYVPSKIKMYKKHWFDKYVIQEITLTFDTNEQEDLL